MLFNLFETLLSIIFPPTEDEKHLRKETAEMFERRFCIQRVGGAYALSSFGDEVIRAAVHLNKFHNNKKAQKLLARLLFLFLVEKKETPLLLIPVPLSRTRERSRKHNQVLSVIRVLPPHLPHVTVYTSVLEKVKDTSPQTSLSRRERKQNVRGVFVANSRYRNEIEGKHVVLLDDVITTGSTLHEAKNALLECNPLSVTCVALAH